MSETWLHRAYAAGSTDSQGNTIDTWGDPTELSGCLFDPGGTAEPGYQGRVVSEPTLYAPRTTISARDLFIGRGATWEVNGEVGDWDPSLPVVVKLRRVEG